MPSAAQTAEAREALADFVREALRVVDAFEAIPNWSSHAVPDECLRGRLYDLVGSKNRCRMYMLPDEMVRP